MANITYGLLASSKMVSPVLGHKSHVNQCHDGFIAKLTQKGHLWSCAFLGDWVLVNCNHQIGWLAVLGFSGLRHYVNCNAR